MNHSVNGPGYDKLKASNSSTPNLRMLDTQSILSSPSTASAAASRSVLQFDSHSSLQKDSHSDSQIDSVLLHDWNPPPFWVSQKCNASPESISMEWETSKGHHSAFPSPPLSPKLRPYKSERSSTSITPDSQIFHGIICVPNWRKGQTIRNYRYDTRNFLSRYKLFNNGDTQSTDHYSANQRQPRYFRNNDNNSGLRKSLLKHHHHHNNNHNHIHNQGKYTEYKSKSPYHHHRVGIASSPPPNIASIGLVTDAPQYIPMVSWQKLPDYCPPVTTLPNNNNKCLKVEWKGSPLNLSQDPLKSNLHPAELVLASILRLPCDLYLDSKRRLFLEKVCKLQNGLPFRRTDAQKACRIDVNKASRLYSAFEKVGWLNDSNFIKYLK